jgi:4-diphosphocytidyl-2-C-methyl-D-erythritol kinase
VYAFSEQFLRERYFPFLRQCVFKNKIKFMLINSHAKINIGLEILNKRPDNYHNINTFFFKIGLCDEIIIEKAENFSFEFQSDLQIRNEDNIAYQTAIRMVSLFDIPKTFSITIRKIIPAGAGLGGGSSNAASVIRGLTEIFGIEVNSQSIKELALSLGSDVPFFLLETNAAIGKGRGEILSPMNLELPYHILLVFPGIHVSTALAYKSLNRSDEIVGETDYSSLIDVLINQPELISERFINHFEEPVFNTYPLLGDIKSTLLSSGAVYASMSGSGSTMYGFFGTEGEAIAAETKFKNFGTFIHKPI